MALTNTLYKTGPLSCNGSTTEFSYTFQIADADDITVTHTDAAGTETTLTKVASSPSTDEYTVSGVGVSGGGSITTGSTYASGETITMTRNMSLEQPRTFTATGGYRGETIEDALDEVVMQVQQLQEQVDRSLRLAVSDTNARTLPASAERASKYMAFDASGDITASLNAPGDVTVSTFAETLVDDTSAAAMRTTLELGSGKHNIAATVAPTATDDSSLGYAAGSRWIDVTADRAYVCLDATATAAVWARDDLPVSQDAGTTAPTVNDDSSEGYRVGSTWVDTTADKTYTLADASVGAAVWKQTSNYSARGWVFVEKVTADNDALLEFAHNGIDAAGTEDFIDGWSYKIEVSELVPATANSSLYGHLYESGAYRTGSDTYKNEGMYANATDVYTNYGAGAAGMLVAYCGLGTQDGWSGVLYLYNLGSTTYASKAHGVGVGWGTAFDLWCSPTAGQNDYRASTKFKLALSSGNDIVSGEFRLFRKQDVT